MSNIILPGSTYIIANDSNTGEGRPVDARQSVQYYKDIVNIEAPYVGCQVIVRENDSTDNAHPKGIYVITALTELYDVDANGIKPLKEVVGATKEDIGLGNVDNTSDLNKPISTATQTALNNKANSTDLISAVNTINTALNGKADKATTLAGYGITDAYTKAEVNSSLSGKANTSDVNTALAGKQNVLTFDNTPTAESTNPVTSGGVKAAIDDVEDALETKADAATTLAGYGITDGYTKTEGQALESAVDSRLDAQDAAVAQLDGHALVIVDTLPTDASPAETPDPEVIYRLYVDDGQGNVSYEDYMYNSDDLTTPIKIATYALPGVDEVPTSGSDNLVKSGGIEKALEIPNNALALNFYPTVGGYYSGDVNNIGKYVPNSSWAFLKIRVSKYDVLLLSTIGGSGAEKAYFVTDLQNNVLADSSGVIVFTNYKITITGDGYLYVNCKTNELHKFSLTICADNTNLEGTFVQNGVIDTNGNFVSTGDTFKIYRYVVQEGDYVRIQTIRDAQDSDSRSFAYAYNNTDKVGVVASAAPVVLDVNYRVPSGVNNICVYCNTSKLSTPVVSLISRHSRTSILNEIDLRIEDINTSISDIETTQEQVSEEIDDISEEIDDINADIDEFKTILAPETIYTTDDLYADGQGYKGYYYDLSDGVGSIAPANPSKYASDPTTFGCLEKIAIRKNQFVSVKTIGGNNARAYAVTDSSRKILVVAAANENTMSNPFTYSVLEDGYLYVNCRPNTLTGFEVKIGEQDIISSFDERISQLEELESGLSGEVEELAEEVDGLKDKTVTPKISNPSLDLRVGAISQLRVLDIGNSFTSNAISMLSDFVTAAGVDISDMCLYTAIRGGGSFKSFYDSWHNQDIYPGETEPTCNYGVAKIMGGITQTISGSNLLERLHSCLIDNRWDLILIHQVSNYSDDYQDWEGNGEGGYLKEFLRIIRTYQPNATIGCLMGHVSYNQSPNNDTAAHFPKIADGVKWLYANYGVDFIIPVATAIENLRASETLQTLYPNVTKGYSIDGHHLATGLAQYVANATYYQCIIGKRYNKTVYGNTLTKVADKTGATYPDDCIDVTQDNKAIAQMCAILACNDMYNITSPDGITI